MRNLIVIAHMDDELYGMLGSILKFRNNNEYIKILCLTKSENRIHDFKWLCKKNNINYEILDYPILKLSKENQSELSDIIFNNIVYDKIDKVFSHTDSDIHSDHKMVFNSTLLAVRPKINSTVNEFLTFKISDSNIWSFSNNFNPNYFINISEYMEKKMEFISLLYSSELYPNSSNHPRSLININHENAFIGSKIGVEYAEEFQLIFKRNL